MFTSCTKQIQWTLVITNSLGPVKLLCYIKILLYPCWKNNKIQRNVELWDQENYFVISVFFITRVHCTKGPLNLSCYLILSNIPLLKSTNWKYICAWCLFHPHRNNTVIKFSYRALFLIGASLLLKDSFIILKSSANLLRSIFLVLFNNCCKRTHITVTLNTK